MAIPLKNSKTFISFLVVALVLWTVWFATTKRAEAAALLTGTPVAVDWGTAQDPTGQNITIPADATAVYMFWNYWVSTNDLGLQSATLNGASPDQSFEIPTLDEEATGVSVWYNPPTGSQTLDVAWDTTPNDGPESIVAFVKGGDTTGWRDVDADQGVTSEAVAVTLTTVSGDLVIKFDQRDGATPPSLTSGWTDGQTATQNSSSVRLSYITAAGSTQEAASEEEANSTIVAVSIPVAPTSNSVNFFWRAEGTTLDGTHDFSAGDTTATLNPNAAINTDAVKIGTNGLDSPDNDSTAVFTVSSNDLISNVEGSIGFWVRYVNWTTDHFSLLAQQNSQAANNIAIFSSGTDDATGREVSLRVRRAGVSNVSITTTDADLQENTWYFIIVRWDEPNSDMRIEVYNENGSLRTAFENLTQDFDQPQGLDELFIGDTVGAGGAFDQHIDNIFIADDYSEPLEDKMNITSWTEYEGGASILPVEIRGGTNVRGGVIFR